MYMNDLVGKKIELAKNAMAYINQSLITVFSILPSFNGFVNLCPM